MPDMSIERINQIVSLNCFGQGRNDSASYKAVLWCFKSFFNHSRNSNVRVAPLTKTMEFIFAKEDIKKGEELLLDYCNGVTNTAVRNKLLEKYGIVETVEDKE